jgi:hypothetical protein
MAAEVGAGRYQVMEIGWLLGLGNPDGTPNEYTASHLKFALVSGVTLVRNTAVLYDCRRVGIREGLMGYTENNPFEAMDTILGASIIVTGDRAASYRPRLSKKKTEVTPELLDLHMATPPDNALFAHEAKQLVDYWADPFNRSTSPTSDDPWWIRADVVRTKHGDELEKKYGYRAVWRAMNHLPPNDRSVRSVYVEGHPISSPKYLSRDGWKAVKALLGEAS